MTEGRPARASGAYPTAHSSVLGWIDPPETRGKKAGAKRRDSDEDAKSWAGFERRHRQALSKEPRKGPAFWNKTVTIMEQQKMLTVPFRGSGLILPDVDLCMCPRLRKVVYLLVLAVLTLFFIMMTLVVTYIVYANTTDSVLLRLGGQHRRLSEAVVNTAVNQRLQCIPCQKNWVQMADSCYFFTSEKMTWDNCVLYCEAQQASILIGATEGEMAFVKMETRKRFTIRSKKLVHAHYWIGLKYNATKQTWLWADEAHLHIKMSSPESTSLLSEDACVAFHNGHEDTRNCTYNYYCLCKKKTA